MSAFEANFDGLVGTTHHYGGLSFGNLASERHAGLVSSPREAALQGLAKMRALARRGFRQGVLPPHERPDLLLLRRVGFTGDDAAVLRRAAAEAPGLLAQAGSASAMWAANAATVSPGPDTADGRTHFTPANLCSHLHRSIEAPTTARVLRAIFPEGAAFAHHAPLPAGPALADEGAANHTRLCGDEGAPGVELFVYGRSAAAGEPAPLRYPARQAREAGEAIARLHGLDPARTVFAAQAPDAIDAGAFHNDVVAVGSRDVLFFHERAFRERARVLDELRRALDPVPLRAIEVPDAALGLGDAVASYLFNSQLLARPDGRMLLVAPEECRRSPRVWQWLEELLASGGPVAEVLTFDLRQSMRNGGGPACLRLRVVLDGERAAAVAPGVWLDDALDARLVAWIGRHHRDRLTARELADPALLDECRTALDELTAILGLGALYPFQQA
ncbi:MAG: N-succinylarginine dihydrolase [Deltaproteobacteria bacterium]|nr:N-succinylarginine dihydrolase [Deltaproteobacteria bacterium]